jgi:hypothetical protein
MKDKTRKNTRMNERMKSNATVAADAYLHGDKRSAEENGNTLADNLGRIPDAPREVVRAGADETEHSQTSPTRRQQWPSGGMA